MYGFQLKEGEEQALADSAAAFRKAVVALLPNLPPFNPSMTEFARAAFLIAGDGCTEVAELEEIDAATRAVEKSKAAEVGQ